MKKIAIAIFSIALLRLVASEGDSYKPKEGYVPNARTAMRIAEAVWIPIYGEKEIESEHPFTATLKNGVWTVEGTLHFSTGGVALAEIAQDDGRILRVIHGK